MNYKNDDERMDDEKKLVLLCGILGFLDTDEQFYGVRGVTKDRKIAGNAITNIISIETTIFDHWLEAVITLFSTNAILKGPISLFGSKSE